MPPDDPRIEALESRIREAREAARPLGESGANEGLQAGIELIGAIVGGGVLGYALDFIFGTEPILLILFLFLGIAAGFLSVWKITQGIGTAVGFAPLHKRKKDAKQTLEQDVKQSAALYDGDRKP